MFTKKCWRVRPPKLLSPNKTDVVFDHLLYSSVSKMRHIHFGKREKAESKPELFRSKQLIGMYSVSNHARSHDRIILYRETASSGVKTRTWYSATFRSVVRTANQSVVPLHFVYDWLLHNKKNFQMKFSTVIYCYGSLYEKILQKHGTKQKADQQINFQINVNLTSLHNHIPSVQIWQRSCFTIHSRDGFSQSVM